MTRRLYCGIVALAFVMPVATRVSAQGLPGAPSGVVVQVGGSTVFVTWAPPTSGSTPSSYSVEILAASTGTTVGIVNVGTAQNFVVTLVDGTYLVRVRAHYADGSSVPATDVPATVGPQTPTNVPLPPQDLRVQLLETGTVNLSWNMLTVSAPATSFIIDVGSAPGLSNLGSFDTGSPVMTLTSAAPAPGIYFVRVRARNAFGASAPSAEVMLTVTGGGGCSAPPLPPGGLNATLVGALLTLNWGAALSDGPILGYRIEVGSAAGLSDLTQILVGPATIFSATAPSGTYFVRVRGINACGESGPSNEVVVTVP